MGPQGVLVPGGRVGKGSPFSLPRPLGLYARLEIPGVAGGRGRGDRRWPGFHRWRQRTGVGGACVHSCFPSSCGDGGKVLILTGLGSRTLQEGKEADRLEKAVLA